MKTMLEKNNNVDAIQLKVAFDTFVNNFDKLLGALEQIKNEERKGEVPQCHYWTH
ncbi:hypothetical protein [Paenibacillus silviterrae]|uniref:hypothetical protein n=1 Tax=Paenibacillus silviterrae TaxID=3242194 RepID=UPI002543E845|nr:hypothetical protein [Paenibacillus chinjuensis]